MVGAAWGARAVTVSKRGRSKLLIMVLSSLVRRVGGKLRGVGVDVVDEAVVLGLLRGEPPVAVGIGLDLVQGLTGVLGDQPLHRGLDVQRLLGLDPDVAGRTAQAS